MLKTLEIYTDDSALNRAKSNEPLFILMGRDTAAPQAIRQWCVERIRQGKNKTGDEQVLKAVELARQMEEYQKSL